MTNSPDPHITRMRRKVHAAIERTIAEESDYAGRPVTALEAASPIQYRVEKYLIAANQEKPVERALKDVKSVLQDWEEPREARYALTRVLDGLPVKLRNAAYEKTALVI